MSDLNQNSNNFAAVKACFVAGFYPNVCRVDRKVGNLKSKQEKKVLPHVTSVLRERNLKSLKSILNNLPSEWIVYEEKSRVERLCLVRNITAVTPLTLALFGGPMYIPKNNVISLDDDSDSENDEPPTVKFILDDWIYFVSDEDIAVMIHEMRIKLNALFMKTLANLDKKSGPLANDTRVIDLIACVLEAEDRNAGFKCPKDVGIRPILLPVKSNWRNKNKVQKRVPEYVPNGKMSIQSYGESQQRQRNDGRQFNNTHNATQRFQQDSLVYRKNDDKSATSNNHDFDAYVAHFKCNLMLKPEVRYFVLHASTKAVVIESFKQNRKWQYSAQVLRQFKTIKNVRFNRYVCVDSFFFENCFFISVCS